jgi:hypothetical protein
VKK